MTAVEPIDERGRHRQMSLTSKPSPTA